MSITDKFESANNLAQQDFDEPGVIRLLKNKNIPAAQAYLKTFIAKYNPYNWRPYYYLTLILDAAGNTREAELSLQEAVARKPTLLPRLESIGLGKYASALSATTTLLMHQDVINGSAAEFIEAKENHRVQPWPRRIEINAPDEVGAFVEKHILRNFEISNQYPIKTTQVFTFGSCFAVNIANALREAGVKVANTLIEEDVNSTFANRYLMQYIVEGNVNSVTDRIESHFGKEIRERIEENIRSADLLIITIGVAPCFFDEQGEFYLRTKSAEDKAILNKVKMRTTTVSENIDNINYMIESIYKVNPGAQIVLTLSPVPLAGTTEFDSPILADCVSKSILRASLHEFVTQRPDILYWPSFEIVKWLGSHLPFKLFSLDDGHSRHVSHWVITMIMGLFVKKMFVAHENDAHDSVLK